MLPPALEAWHNLQAAASGITEPDLAASVKAFNEDLIYADLPEALTAGTSIEASCNAFGFPDPG